MCLCMCKSQKYFERVINIMKVMECRFVHVCVFVYVFEREGERVERE